MNKKNKKMANDKSDTVEKSDLWTLRWTWHVHKSYYEYRYAGNLFSYPGSRTIHTGSYAIIMTQVTNNINLYKIVTVQISAWVRYKQIHSFRSAKFCYLDLRSLNNFKNWMNHWEKKKIPRALIFTLTISLRDILE